MVSQFIWCRDCGRSYDPQSPRCPACDLPTVVSRMAINQGGKPPRLTSRAVWSWGTIGAIAAWLMLAAVIVYFTADG